MDLRIVHWREEHSSLLYENLLLSTKRSTLTAPIPRCFITAVCCVMAGKTSDSRAEFPLIKIVREDFKVPEKWEK